MDSFIFVKVRKREIGHAAVKQALQVVQIAVQAMGAFHAVNHRYRPVITLT